MITKGVNFLIYAERGLAYFYSSGTRIGIYISTIISAAADKCPDEMICFPAGLHYLLTVQNITEIDKSEKGCLNIAIYANFSEIGCLYIAIYANFSKREKEWIGRPKG